MITLVIAFRSLRRRKTRMIMIGLLVFLGTLLIVFGDTFSRSAASASREAITDYFTGDCILYSAKSREKPSPFSFTTPLPVIAEPRTVEIWLEHNPLVDKHVAIAQNYGVLSAERNGNKYEVPFFFYAVDPVKYRTTFPNVAVRSGVFFDTDAPGEAAGVVLSAFQAKNYAKNYNIELKSGDAVTLLSLNEGGSVNAYPSKVIGLYEPLHYRNVFDYINFLDITSYSRLYNFTGVDSSSLPDAFNRALASSTDDDIFGLAGAAGVTLDPKRLVSRELTGYTMIAVKLKNPASMPAFADQINKSAFGLKTALWNEASGFFAYIAGIIQAVIYGATLLIFLIVIFILMNTLIINVLERTGEIGTLRAIGGEKSFITSIFLWESFLLNGAAALLGMGVSLALVLLWRGGEGIVLPEIMQQYLVGGGGIRLRLSPWPFVNAFGLIVAVSSLATVYPIRIATAISPLKAMSGK